MVCSRSVAKRRRLAGLRRFLGPLECLAAVGGGRVSSPAGAWFAFDAQPCADRVRGEGVGAELLAFGPGAGVGELLEPSGGDEVVALLEQLHRDFGGLVAHRAVVEGSVGLGEGAVVFASPRGAAVGVV